jgi:protoporphyrinogen IX oxidase
MLWIKAIHVIFVICWFAGLFYLPRLFVYHAMAQDQISIERFKLMERRLYRGITTPSMVLALLAGFGLLHLNWSSYAQEHWMHAKLGLVAVLMAYHFACGYHVKQFARDANQKSDRYFRWFNEFPVLLLVGIVILVIVRPF